MKNNMKRILSFALSAIMCAMCISIFSGCGSDSAKEDWEYISDKGKLTIGITYFAPMNYLDENDQLTGFETEFAKAVCEVLGVEADFAVIDWNSKEIELNSKNIDCIWNGMTIDDERLTTMDISTPYMANKQVLVVKNENVEKYNTAEAVKDLTIVAEKGSAGEDVATGVNGETFFAAAKYTAVDVQSKALTEVLAGTADGCVVDYVLSIGMIGEGTDYSDLAVVNSAAFSEEQYGIAFRKNSPETLAKVNAAIQELANNGKLAEIAAKYKLSEQLLVKPEN